MTGCTAFLTGQGVNNSLRIGFSMAQIGEFSFIIAGLGLALNATSYSLYPIIVAVSAITTFTTPYLMQLSGYLSNKTDQHLSPRLRYFLESYTNGISRAIANSKQRPFYRKAAIRWIINSIIVAIVFKLTEAWILPEVIAVVGEAWIARILGWLAAIILASPFIWGMLIAFRVDPLNSEAATNSTLHYLSCLVTIFEITLLSVAYFDTWLITVLLLLAVAGFFASLYKQLEKSYRWFEERLVHNLKNEPIQQKRYEELAPWDNYLVEFEISPNSGLNGKSLQQHQLRQKFGINVVAIYRGNDVKLSPRGDEIIQASDKLILLGRDEEIEKFITLFTEQQADAVIDMLEKFDIRTIQLTENNSWANKSIRDSRIRENTKCLVVGIERRGTRLLNPDSTTILEAGDILFIVGETNQLKNI